MQLGRKMSSFSVMKLAANALDFGLWYVLKDSSPREKFNVGDLFCNSH